MPSHSALLFACAVVISALTAGWEGGFALGGMSTLNLCTRVGIGPEEGVSLVPYQTSHDVFSK